ncbi:MAG: hypothetical protein AB7K24_30000 [Gemmataceae bacterium]
MRFTVAWTDAAAQELAALWMAAVDRNSLTRAANVIDQLLAQNPSTLGNQSFDTVRTLVIPPIGVDFEVVVDDLRVWVLSVWETSD